MPDVFATNRCRPTPSIVDAAHVAFRVIVPPVEVT
jgi:hypothetical protein